MLGKQDLEDRLDNVSQCRLHYSIADRRNS
jgi:hypothetical protein